MAKRDVILCIIISVTASTCSVREQRLIYREGDRLRSNLSRLDSLYNDSLMVFFEQGFNNTLIEIRVNDTVIYEEIISTAREIQLATVKNVGSRKKNQNFSIRINNNKSIPIKIASPYRYVGISYLGDTVYIDYLMHYPMYE